MLRAGLWFYDRLGGRTMLPPSRRIDLARDPAGAPLLTKFRTAFEYSDCRVDDSRLVIANAVDAAERGAAINTRTRFVSAMRRNREWLLRVAHVVTTAEEEIHARILVNAAGPWVNAVRRTLLLSEPGTGIRLDKGSHIVVRRRFVHDWGYVLQNSDRRVVFVIPYLQDFTLIGTTETDYQGDPAAVSITQPEVDYLLKAVNAWFRDSFTYADIVWSYSGIRALCETPGRESRKLSREYALVLEGDGEAPPLLEVYGGKLTTYRHLAEQALARLSAFVSAGGPWTAGVPLPGGQIAGTLDRFMTDCVRKYSFLPGETLRRMVSAYGSRVGDILGTATSLPDLGKVFGGGLTEAELRFLATREWAMTADDVLWRRSKLGLRVTAAESQQIEHWLARFTA
jgi:glycerol-3-phosphate dehydrogenase